MVAHCLQIVDEEFARDQYARAKHELSGSLVGFSYAREWPRSWEGRQDVDAGAVVPGLGASAGASGLAILGAASFHDRDYLDGLLASLNFAGFPVTDKDALYYAAIEHYRLGEGQRPRLHLRGQEFNFRAKRLRARVKRPEPYRSIAFWPMAPFGPIDHVAATAPDFPDVGLTDPVVGGDLLGHRLRRRYVYPVCRRQFDVAVCCSVSHDGVDHIVALGPNDEM